MRENKIHIGFLFCMLFLAGQTFGQQQLQSTQYMHNKLKLNPGFAGNVDGVHLQGTYRSQWIGFEGAPTLQMINLNMPFDTKNIGIGVNLFRYSQGISQAVTAEMSYAYRIPIGEGSLGLGISASIRNLVIDFSDLSLYSSIPIHIDPAIQNEKLSKWLLNMGVGMFLQQENFYAGISAPRLFKNSLDFDDDELLVAREVHHYYAMVGYNFRITSDIQLTPQLLYKYAFGSPDDLDLNLNAKFLDTYLFGLNYRFGGGSENIGESVDLILGYQISKKFFIAFSYDFTFSEIRDHESGSVELFVRYAITQSSQENYENPRYF